MLNLGEKLDYSMKLYKWGRCFYTRFLKVQTWNKFLDDKLMERKVLTLAKSGEIVNFCFLPAFYAKFRKYM